MSEQSTQRADSRREELGGIFSGGAAAGDADSMIRANETAQAIEIDTLKDTVREYQEQIGQLKAQAERNAQLVENMRSLNEATVRSLQEVVNSYVDTLTQSQRVLRDVDFGKMQEELEQLGASVEEFRKTSEESRQQSDDYAHRENVRVYRNVQAATEQLLKTQTGELSAQFEELKKPQKPKTSWIQILTLLLAAACVVLEVLQLTGLF